MTPLRIYSLITLAAAVASVPTVVYLRRHRKTDAERERERRELINRIGRITDGTVNDVREITPDGHGPMQLVIFQYDVAGVSYEAAQDVMRQMKERAAKIWETDAAAVEADRGVFRNGDRALTFSTGA